MTFFRARDEHLKWGRFFYSKNPAVKDIPTKQYCHLCGYQFHDGDWFACDGSANAHRTPTFTDYPTKVSHT